MLGGRSRPAAAFIALAGLAVVAAGCGDQEAASDGASLRWVGAARIFTPDELPDDRVMSGRLKNVSAAELRLDADEARLVDGEGANVTAAVVFSASVGHGLYSPRARQVEPDPESLRRRLGELAVLAPGETTPVTLAWRLADDQAFPTRLEVGSVEIDMPARSSSAMKRAK